MPLTALRCPTSCRAFLCRYQTSILSLWLVFVLVLCLVPVPIQVGQGIPHIDKIFHFTFYFIPSIYIGWTKFHRDRWLVALCAWGIIVEGLQSLTTYRSASFADECANLLGIAVGWGIAELLFLKGSHE